MCDLDWFSNITSHYYKLRSYLRFQRGMHYDRSIEVSDSSIRISLAMPFLCLRTRSMYILTVIWSYYHIYYDLPWKIGVGDGVTTVVVLVGVGGSVGGSPPWPVIKYQWYSLFDRNKMHLCMEYHLAPNCSMFNIAHTNHVENKAWLRTLLKYYHGCQIYQHWYK